MRGKVILVEGLPGSGKSTTAQWLYWTMARIGWNPVWYYEIAYNHPLNLNCAVDEISKQELVTHCLEHWNNLVCADRSGHDVLIIDSGFFQKNVMYMMNQEISNEAIFAYSKEVEQLLDRVECDLIYLTQSCVASHVRTTYGTRGKSFEEALVGWATSRPFSRRRGYRGLRGSLTYWEDYKKLCDSIYNECNLKKLQIDVSAHDWISYRDSISEFLHIPEIPAAEKSDVPFEMAGKYIEFGTGKVIEIVEASGAFLARNLLYSLEQESVLISIADNRFALRGHDVELQFDFGDFHQVTFEVHSSWLKVDGGRFEKIGE